MGTENRDLEELSMHEDKRELTEKELKRKDCFEKFNSEMQQKGYKMKNIIINTQQAKTLCLLIMLPFMALAFWIYYHVNGFDLDCLSLGFVVALIVLILCLTILHELIHGITWGLFAKNHFHSIDFGIIWSSFSPYYTYLFRTAEKMAVFLGGCYAYISFRRQRCNSFCNGQSITAVFSGRIYDSIGWRRFSDYIERHVIPH